MKKNKQTNTEDTSKGYTITQVAEVMSHVILEAVEVFNKQSKIQFKDRPEECPEFNVKIVPIMFSPEQYIQTGIESRAVFTLEMKQFGSNTVIWRKGYDFKSDKERQNVNRWLPRIWQEFFQYIINTSMFYQLALNPDNPEVRKANEQKS